MKKAGKYFHQGFAQDALAIWAAAQTVADYRDAAAMKTAVAEITKMWVAHILATAAKRGTEVTTAAKMVAADAAVVAEGSWSGAAYAAAVAAGMLAEEAGMPELVSSMQALAESSYPY